MFLRAGTPTNRSQRVVNRAKSGPRSRFRADPKISQDFGAIATLLRNLIGRSINNPFGN